MPEIRPFRGLRYNLARVNLRDVVAPPYDVIGSEYQAELYERSPYNIIRLILGREADRYGEAARHLGQWTNEQILVRDGEPAIYALEQSFQGPDGKTYNRRGFIAACRVDDFSDGTVLPHERTLSKPKEDRFRLMQATNTNLSQIFSIYSDPEGEVEASFNPISHPSPLLEVHFEDVTNRLWAVRDTASISAVTRAMTMRPVLIADGHHRYETALAYRDLMRMKTRGKSGDGAFEFTMMFFASMDSDGLIVFPTHRVVHSLDSLDVPDFLRDLAKHFAVEQQNTLDDLQKSLTRASMHAFGLIHREQFHLLRLREGTDPGVLIADSTPAEVRELDVTLLHSYIFEGLLHLSRDAQERKLNLDYVKTASEAAAAVRSGRAQLGFLMNPTRLEQIRRVSRAGYTMPQKSTFFYPKLVSGLIMNPLD